MTEVADDVVVADVVVVVDAADVVVVADDVVVQRSGRVSLRDLLRLRAFRRRSESLQPLVASLVN